MAVQGLLPGYTTPRRDGKPLTTPPNLGASMPRCTSRAVMGRVAPQAARAAHRPARRQLAGAAATNYGKFTCSSSLRTTRHGDRAELESRLNGGTQGTATGWERELGNSCQPFLSVVCEARRKHCAVAAWIYSFAASPFTLGPCSLGYHVRQRARRKAEEGTGPCCNAHCCHAHRRCPGIFASGFAGAPSVS